jgi:hypothetical protein
MADDTNIVDLAQTRKRKSPRSLVQIRGGEIDLAVDAAELGLIRHDPEIFQFGDQIVWVGPVLIKISDDREAEGLRAIALTTANLVEKFTATCNFQKFSAREEKWREVDCPKAIAEIYLARVGAWRLPVLTGIATAPVLLPDGRIIERPGYDAATGIYYHPQGVAFEPVPPYPTRHGAEQALARIKSLYATFPFVSDVDRSVGLSALLTLISRWCYLHAPAHAVTAPQAGSGKSMLIDLASIVATGHEAEVCEFSRNPEESSKAFGALLMAGTATVCFDNIEEGLVFDGALLNKAITQRTVLLRVLSQSKMARARTDGLTIFADGNSLTIGGDMTRRCLRASLDAKVDRPELREFEGENPSERATRERPALVRDALTVLRAYIQAGRPDPIRKLGSFEAWSALVPSALCWLGEEDPCQSMDAIRGEDPQRSALLAILTLWEAELGSTPLTAREVIEHADKADGRGYLSPAFRDALLNVAEQSGKQRGTLSNMRLGLWLKKVRNRVVGLPGARFVSAGTTREGSIRWQVEKFASAPAADEEGR